jgi:uncharacterized protein YbjQ (UPF0145 family)
MRIVTTDTLGDTPIKLGSVVFASAVVGANIVRDVREAITNYTGGNMTRYEYVLDLTIDRAMDILTKRAVEKGYDGVVALRLSHPTIVMGALEVVATGTGFNYVSPLVPQTPLTPVPPLS